MSVTSWACGTRASLTSNSALRARFRKKDQNHDSAFFELFLHELFGRLGLSVAQVDPALPGGSYPVRFRVTGSGSPAYVEADRRTTGNQGFSARDACV